MPNIQEALKQVSGAAHLDLESFEDLIFSTAICDFLQGCHEEPSNTMPRLILADYLQENGEELFAILLRLSISSSTVLMALLKMNPLANQVYHEFLGYSSPTKNTPWTFEQGLLKLTYHNNPDLNPRIERFLETGWLIQLNLPRLEVLNRVPFQGSLNMIDSLTVGKSPDHFELLGRFERLHLLNLRGISLHGDPMKTLLASPVLDRLSELNLSATHLQDDDLELLSNRPHLEGLRRLDLSYNRIGNEGIVAITKSRSIHGLESLDLGNNPIGEKGAKAIAECPHFKSLRKLNLFSEWITESCFQALATSPYLHESIRREYAEFLSPTLLEGAGN